MMLEYISIEHHFFCSKWYTSAGAMTPCQSFICVQMYISAGKIDPLLLLLLFRLPSQPERYGFYCSSYQNYSRNISAEKPNPFISPSITILA